ncbi:MAG: hypothetical protein U1E67_11775 [Hyphomicrobiales bacterium]
MSNPTQNISAEIGFLGWLGQAKPGDILEYHRGFLAVDRAWSNNRGLDLLASRAVWAADRGLVDLVQRRVGPEQYRYLAIARPKPDQVASSLSQLITEDIA